MDKQQLKPCPFCGGAAAFDQIPGAGQYIECRSCKASTNMRYATGDDPVPLLIEQWNRRAPQPPSASDELLRLMPEVLAALRSPGPNVSLVRDVEKALAAPSPGVDAVERKILYTVKVSGALQTFSRTVHSLSLVEGEYDLYAGAYREPHPPSRDCMCAACRPSFDNGADDPARRYDITRGGANG